MASISRFEDIDAWQKARDLADRIHKASSQGLFGRDYGLRDQINRASGSAMDNIAEGFDGGSRAEFIRFLGYSQRSCTEVMSQLHRALDREYITREEFESLYALASAARSKVGGFIKYLKSTPGPDTKH